YHKVKETTDYFKKRKKEKDRSESVKSCSFFSHLTKRYVMGFFLFFIRSLSTRILLSTFSIHTRTHMASSTSQKVSCATCGKAAGLFTCRGCAKDFCTQHVAEHRQTLGKQMDEVTLSHDQLRQAIAECTAEPRRHPLMKQIDEWEKQSVAKINQAADDA